MTMSKQKKTNPDQDVIAAKKAAVMGKEKKPADMRLKVGLSVALVAVAALLAVILLWPADRAGVGVAPVGRAEAGIITHQEADVTAKARYFTYETPDGIAVRYFLLKSSDGTVRAAFDACDVCWRSGLGYQQDGDFMVCRNCGRRFASLQIMEERGGCNPSPLPRVVKDGRILIQVKDVLDGRRLFDLKSAS